MKRQLGTHPNDVPGHLTRSEMWSRILYGMMIGVSLGVASINAERFRSSLGGDDGFRPSHHEIALFRRIQKSRNATFLIREIAAGRRRIFVTDERPPGWLLLEREGLVARDGRWAAELTDLGRVVVRMLAV